MSKGTRKNFLAAVECLSISEMRELAAIWKDMGYQHYVFSCQPRDIDISYIDDSEGNWCYLDDVDTKEVAAYFGGCDPNELDPEDIPIDKYEFVGTYQEYLSFLDCGGHSVKQEPVSISVEDYL